MNVFPDIFYYRTLFIPKSEIRLDFSAEKNSMHFYFKVWVKMKQSRGVFLPDFMTKGKYIGTFSKFPSIIDLAKMKIEGFATP